MRVLVQADMDGVAQLTDHRECWPVCLEYWRTGRAKTTADAAAAAEGLVAGGATEVVVRDSHGAGWPNLIAAALPPRARLEAGGFGARPPEPAFDATFQVGRHARCGTRGGSLSHTGVPDLRLAVDGRPLTESHCLAGAWPLGLPVLGIVGDAALGPELTGSLAGTPFLAGAHVVVLSAKDDPDARAQALRWGADEYLPKPFRPREVAQRVQALLGGARPAPAA
jgi:D-amino peptidase